MLKNTKESIKDGPQKECFNLDIYFKKKIPTMIQYMYRKKEKDDDVMNIQTLKHDLAQCDKTLPIILSKDGEGNNYYKLERCAVGYYAPLCAWYGELSENKESLATHEIV